MAAREMLDGRPENHYVDAARSVLGQADAQVYVLGLSGDDLERVIATQPLDETANTLRQSQIAADSLRRLADDFDVARRAIRDQLGEQLDRIDRTQLEFEGQDRPTPMPASGIRSDRAAR